VVTLLVLGVLFQQMKKKITDKYNCENKKILKLVRHDILKNINSFNQAESITKQFFLS
jgi:hypothetical protein